MTQLHHFTSALPTMRLCPSPGQASDRQHQHKCIKVNLSDLDIWFTTRHHPGTYPVHPVHNTTWCNLLALQHYLPPVCWWSKVYLMFRPGTTGFHLACVTQLEDCIGEIRSWIALNILKHNDNKTEFLIWVDVSHSVWYHVILLFSLKQNTNFCCKTSFCQILSWLRLGLRKMLF